MLPTPSHWDLIGELVWCTKALMQQELVVLLGNGTLGRQGLEHWRRLSKYLQPKPTGLQEEVGSLGPRLEIWDYLLYSCLAYRYRDWLNFPDSIKDKPMNQGTSPGILRAFP